MLTLQRLDEFRRSGTTGKVTDKTKMKRQRKSTKQRSVLLQFYVEQFMYSYDSYDVRLNQMGLLVLLAAAPEFARMTAV